MRCTYPRLSSHQPRLTSLDAQLSSLIRPFGLFPHSQDEVLSREGVTLESQWHPGDRLGMRTALAIEYPPLFSIRSCNNESVVPRFRSERANGEEQSYSELLISTEQSSVNSRLLFRINSQRCVFLYRQPTWSGVISPAEHLRNRGFELPTRRV